MTQIIDSDTEVGDIAEAAEQVPEHAHHGNAANGPGYKFLVTAWSIEAAGGPKCYLGRDMIAAHDGLSIDPAGFDAVAMEIAATLMFLGVPARERDEFNAIIESYRGQVVQAGTV